MDKVPTLPILEQVTDSDDDYDETYDASAQVFSPRRAEDVGELLQSNPFESDDDLDSNFEESDSQIFFQNDEGY